MRSHPLICLAEGVWRGLPPWVPETKWLDPALWLRSMPGRGMEVQVGSALGETGPGPGTVARALTVVQVRLQGPRERGWLAAGLGLECRRPHPVHEEVTLLMPKAAKGPG